jgi:hypothetical protein
LKFTNNPSELPKIKKYLTLFQKNLTSIFPNLFLPSSYAELAPNEQYIEVKYLRHGDIPLADAVVFVPRKIIEVIKKKYIVAGGTIIPVGQENYSDLNDPMADELRDKDFDEQEHQNEDDNEPIFDEPIFDDDDYEDGASEDSKGNIVVGGTVVGIDTTRQLMSLFGCCCKMTLNELKTELAVLTTDNVIYQNGKAISDAQLADNTKYNVIFLCEETMSGFSNSLQQNSKLARMKNYMESHFNVGLIDSYFDANLERLVFAHELGHILFGHLEGTIKLWKNRETQANFMASLMLNDKIDSLYMKYKTFFQPREYRRTMLFHINFTTANFAKALLKVLKLR